MKSDNRPTVLLSGFGDEAAVGKSAVEQLAAMSALGFNYYSVRFVDLGLGVRNVMKLDDEEIGRLVALHHQYEMKVCSIGSPIGKVKIADVKDGTSNVFRPFAEYLEQDVMHAISLANRLETKLVRGFSFYPPKGKDPEPYFQQTVDQLGKIADRCRRNGVVFGLELEANLMGSSGLMLYRLHKAVNNPAMVTVFDGGNLSSQNLPPHRCYEEYLRMRDSIGWMHVKDYKIDPELVWDGHVDEERLKNFVPVDIGDSGYEPVLRDFRERLAKANQQMQSLGAPGVFLELEPHLKGGGQFGGFSGPDGMGVALRSLCRLLDYLGIGYKLRDFADVKRK
ncbi:MAG TPA: TIM barrel protein [Planctomycetia bacterium]|nr:TIM barrel protein [Planctomycetia bacterium]